MIQHSYSNAANWVTKQWRRKLLEPNLHILVARVPMYRMKYWRCYLYRSNVHRKQDTNLQFAILTKYFFEVLRLIIQQTGNGFCWCIWIGRGRKGSNVSVGISGKKLSFGSDQNMALYKTPMENCLTTLRDITISSVLETFALLKMILVSYYCILRIKQSGVLSYIYIYI